MLKKNRNGEDKGKQNQNQMTNNKKTTKTNKNSFAENEKESETRGGQAAQALIQRRRRPKRRSTGVCNVGAEVQNLCINLISKIINFVVIVCHLGR